MYNHLFWGSLWMSGQQLVQDAFYFHKQQPPTSLATSVNCTARSTERTEAE